GVRGETADERGDIEQPERLHPEIVGGEVVYPGVDEEDVLGGRHAVRGRRETGDGARLYASL
ncbi:MAG: hypothetical protein MIO92_12875, partial [Methanosarcinaceae archaeon]|nr:hypothetical protein [Methanosarcinaceae archaeon]